MSSTRSSTGKPKAYRGNIERTVRASEGQQKLARARKQVVNDARRQDRRPRRA